MRYGHGVVAPCGWQCGPAAIHPYPSSVVRYLITQPAVCCIHTNNADGMYVTSDNYFLLPMPAIMQHALLAVKRGKAQYAGSRFLLLLGVFVGGKMGIRRAYRNMMTSTVSLFKPTCLAFRYHQTV